MSKSPSITRIRQIHARFEDGPWPWAQANEGAIGELWEREKARKPMLFDGVVLLARENPGEDAPVLRLTFFPVRYAAFLAFKAMGFPEPGTKNPFAMAALCDASGVFLLGEMGGHTANAGQVYFPSGTPDMSDVTGDGRVDLAGSVLRELAEETGMTAGDYAVSDEWHVVREGGLMALMRPLQLTRPAAEAAAQVRHMIAGQDDPELRDAKVVASTEDLADRRIPVFMRHYLTWRMEQASRSEE